MGWLKWVVLPCWFCCHLGFAQQALPKDALAACKVVNVYYLDYSGGDAGLLDTLQSLVERDQQSPDVSYLLYLSDDYDPILLWKGDAIDHALRSLRFSLRNPPRADRDKLILRRLLSEILEIGQFQLRFHFFLPLASLVSIPDARALLVGELPSELIAFGGDAGHRVSAQVSLYVPEGPLCAAGVDRLDLAIYLLHYQLYCIASK